MYSTIIYREEIGTAWRIENTSRIRKIKYHGKKVYVIRDEAYLAEILDVFEFEWRFDKPRWIEVGDMPNVKLKWITFHYGQFHKVGEKPEVEGRAKK